MIRIEQIASFADYEGVPISFVTHARVDLACLESSGEVRPIPMPSRFKDYDRFEEERPSNLSKRFDTSNWGIFAAFSDRARVGGAVAAWNSPAYDLLEYRSDLAALVDIRVAPEHRGKGVATSLIRETEEWSRARGCTELQVETQDINLAACALYKSCGFQVLSIDHDAYPGLDEIRIIWTKRL